MSAKTFIGGPSLTDSVVALACDVGVAASRVQGISVNDSGPSPLFHFPYIVTSSLRLTALVSCNEKSALGPESGVVWVLRNFAPCPVWGPGGYTSPFTEPTS